VGATTLIIKRTAVGKFGNESVGKIYSIEDGLYFIPSLLLKDDIVRRLKHGKVIKYEAKDGVYKLLSEDGMFHGVVEVKDNVLKALRMQSQEDKNHIDKI